MGGREWIRVRARVDTDGFMIEGAQSRMGVKAEKIVDWGYVVEPSRFGTQVPAAHAELDETCVLRVLWAGRDLDWKRVRDIERAVALANTKIVVDDSCSCRKDDRKSNPTFLIIGKLEKVSGGTCGLSASFGNIAA